MKETQKSNNQAMIEKKSFLKRGEIKIATALILLSLNTAACTIKEAQPAPTTPTLTQADITSAIEQGVKQGVEKALEEMRSKPPTPVAPHPQSDNRPYSPQQPEVAYGDSLTTRFNGTYYELIDIRTNQRVDPASRMVNPINNILTGVGNTQLITYRLNPGQAALEQGYIVNNEGPGVYQMRMNRSNYPMDRTVNIADGSVTIVPIANAPAHYVDALNRAISNNWAHNIVRGETR